MNQYKIMLVDDEPDILNLLEKALNIEGFYNITKIDNGISAVTTCREMEPDGEIWLVIERTTEVYGSPVNSLGISEDTKLLGKDGEELSIDDFQQGNVVTVKLKDAFTEETPYYYPTVYEIKMMG